MRDIRESPPTAARAPVLVALAHPSLEQAVAVFAEELSCEQRFFGTAAPRIPRASLENLTTRGGIRLGLMVGDQLVAMSRVEHDGAAVIAVVQRFRGQGLGRHLLESTLRRAATHGHDRITFRSSWRSRSFIGLAESTGATVVDHGRGRIDLVFAVGRSAHIA
jgi:GNAT superfamily N-acetyltransferase